MKMKVEPEWCAVDLVNQRTIYTRFIEELKAVMGGSYKGESVLIDAYADAPVPGGGISVARIKHLIQGYRGDMLIRVAHVVSVSPLDPDKTWARGLTKVEAGEAEAAIVYVPQTVQGVGGGLVRLPTRK